jgi:DNA-binding FadR family transcriptional regulator
MHAPGPTALSAAAQRLRELSLAAEEGSLLGGEEALIAELGFSRSTVRQAARLLEREGLLRVKRGPSGGYFACRPDAATIEGAVSAYLQVLDVDVEDVLAIASALWIEAMVKAARAPEERRLAAVDKLRRLLDTVKDNASFRQLRDAELLGQGVVFDLAGSNYIKLVFDINLAFSQRRLSGTLDEAEPEVHRQFVANWREAKRLECGALAEGSEELAALASRYSRKLWDRTVWQRRGVGGERRP